MTVVVAVEFWKFCSDCLTFGGEHFFSRSKRFDHDHKYLTAPLGPPHMFEGALLKGDRDADIKQIATRFEVTIEKRLRCDTLFGEVGVFGRNTYACKVSTGCSASSGFLRFKAAQWIITIINLAFQFFGFLPRCTDRPIWKAPDSVTPLCSCASNPIAEHERTRTT